jgi:hypothetical protein
MVRRGPSGKESNEENRFTPQLVTQEVLVFSFGELAGGCFRYSQHPSGLSVARILKIATMIQFVGQASSLIFFFFDPNGTIPQLLGTSSCGLGNRK